MGAPRGSEGREDVMNRVLLDSNILVFAFVNPAVLYKPKYREKIMAQVGSKLFYNSYCTIVIPDFILEVEIPRILSKMAVTKGISDPTKLDILINLIERDIRLNVESMKTIGRCDVTRVWTRECLRRAAGLHNRLEMRRQRGYLGKMKKIEKKHQDIILLACAELTDAIMVTADKDMWIFVDKGELDLPIYYFEINDEKKQCRIHTKNICETTCVDEILENFSECISPSKQLMQQKEQE